MDQFTYFELPNGLKGISSHSDSGVSHLAAYVNAGSRDEAENEHGVVHLIEHTAFKGTTKRKAYHILSRLDDIGGDLNAFTTKEHTCIHASFPSKYTERAIELFADLLQNATFPSKEIEKEKLIVIDEINSFKDAPAESIFDDYEELLFSGHPISRNILGTPESVEKISRTTILRFVRKYFCAKNTALSYIGNTPARKVNYWLSKYFSPMVEGDCSHPQRLSFSNYTPQLKIKQADTHQTHIITGNIAYPSKHPKKLALQLLTNILGGPASSSRLNLTLREKNASTYHVEANYQPFSDTGYFSVYLGVSATATEKIINILWKELNLLKHNSLGTMQLHKARLQVAGQMLLWHESKLNEVLWMGRRNLNGEKPESIEDTIKAVEKIEASDLLEVANEIFIPERFSTLIYPAKPFDDE